MTMAATNIVITSTVVKSWLIQLCDIVDACVWCLIHVWHVTWLRQTLSLHQLSWNREYICKIVVTSAKLWLHLPTTRFSVLNIAVYKIVKAMRQTEKSTLLPLCIVDLVFYIKWWVQLKMSFHRLSSNCHCSSVKWWSSLKWWLHICQPLDLVVQLDVIAAVKWCIQM